MFRPPARRREHWPAARTRSLSRRHRATDRTTPQARQAWAEAVRPGKLIKSSIAEPRIELSALSP
jgi:hypothetical protein